jgi:aryl-alcohol dehydrogenase-like predicted oxidoreductase
MLAMILSSPPQRVQLSISTPNTRGSRILASLDAVGKRLNATPASVALAWQIAPPGITAPIASATTVIQLSELVAATQLELDPAAIGQLNAASG